MALDRTSQDKASAMDLRANCPGLVIDISDDEQDRGYGIYPSAVKG